MSRSRILFIRGGAIGDFVLTLPAIRVVREAFPDAHLEILGYKHIVALAEGRGYADATRSIEYGPLASFFARGGELPQDLCAYFAGFGQIISYLYDPDGIFEENLRRAGVKHFLAGSPIIPDDAHAAVFLARPLQSLALYLEDPAAEIRVTPEDEALAVREFGGVAPGAVIHPGSGSLRKNWPVECWAEFLRSWRQAEPDLLIAAVGGEADEERIAELRAEAPWITPFLHLPLPVVAALIRRAGRYVGHDSGISHIAAATGARCALLFGPTDPAVWAPRNAGVRVLAAPGGDLAALSVEAVLAAIPPPTAVIPGL